MQLEETLKEATLRAGTLLRDGAFDISTLDWKHEDDPVTNLDKAAEKLIRNVVLESMFADFTGEEYGRTDNGCFYRFIMDPLDGTKKYIRQDFGCATSIAVEGGSSLVAGAVYDFMSDILYMGLTDVKVMYRGKEVAQQPQRFGRIRIMSEDLHKSEATAPMERKLREREDVDIYAKSGSIALAMAKVAAGVADGLIVKPKRYGVWDVAAGYHLLRLKGFTVTDIEGNPFDYKSPGNGIIAIRPDIDEKVRNYIK